MANKHVHSINDDNFAAEVLARSGPVLIDFTAEWCGPCKRFSPIVEDFASETAGAVTVGELDIDSSPATAARFNIRGAPTVIVFRDGREVARHVGATSKQRLRALVQVESAEYARSAAADSA